MKSCSPSTSTDETALLTSNYVKSNLKNESQASACSYLVNRINYPCHKVSVIVLCLSTASWDNDWKIKTGNILLCSQKTIETPRLNNRVSQHITEVFKWGGEVQTQKCSLQPERRHSLAPPGDAQSPESKNSGFPSRPIFYPHHWPLSVTQ